MERDKWKYSDSLVVVICLSGPLGQLCPLFQLSVSSFHLQFQVNVWELLVLPSCSIGGMVGMAFIFLNSSSDEVPIVDLG